MQSAAAVEITSREVADLLALTDVPAVSRLVRTGKLTPTRKLPGKRGPYLFDRAQVVALAEERKAKFQADADRIDAALAEDVAS